MTLQLGLGPVFAYEWLRATRRWTMYAWRAGFVLVLLGGLALVWLVESHRTGPFTMQAQAVLAKMFFGIIECVAVVTVLLVAPVATAGVICQERARGTLLDVLATDLSSAEVVLGKLAARQLPVLATIAAALPVLAITSLFGGIDPGALGGSFAVIVGLAVIGCALALSLSLWGRKTHEVLLAMYFVWFCWLLLLPVWVVVTNQLVGRPLPWGWLVQTNPLMLTLFAHDASVPWSPGLAAQLRFLAGAVVLAAGLVALTIWRLRPVCVGQSRQRAAAHARSPRWRRPWAPTLDGNPVVWRECHRQPPSRWTRIVWGLYGVLALALSVQAFVMMIAPRGVPGIWMPVRVNVSQVAIGLLLLSVTTAAGLHEERAHGSLDALFATPLPTATIVRGKWRWAFRRVPLLAILPTFMTLLLTAVGRWAGPLLIMALILAQGAAVTSLGLALATWSRRAGRAPALCASACLGMFLGWPVLIFFLSANAPRDDWFPYWVMMGSPVVSMTLLTRASIAPYALDPWPGVAFAALCWTAAYAAAAGTLFGLTLLTFDGCLGRIPDVPGRPKRRRTWPSESVRDTGHVRSGTGGP
jgi:ABC-type transport system involved in multi-copper enzyme maturation permease subunit